MSRLIFASINGLRWKILFPVQKMFLNLMGNIFASLETNFVSATMFPRSGKLINIDRKYDIFATMFPSLPRVLLTLTISFSAGNSDVGGRTLTRFAE